ncbi:MAG: M28 family metallopeptidase [Steroidobacteraceae bacterium]
MTTAIRLAACAALIMAVAADAGAPDDSIGMERLSGITQVLASDAFEGRAPGTAGEAKTVDYLVTQFRAAGLQPGGDAGGWTQAVPLVRTQVPGGELMSVTIGGGRIPLVQDTDIAALTLRPVDRVVVRDAPLVFVGYGVAAPERGWDDYKGVDLRGKIAVFLINDPDFESRPGEFVDGRFGGRAATYYARWTYKYEEAARRGAVGALIVHETEGAGYGWNTCIAPNGEGFDIVRADPARDKLLLQAWLHRDTALRLFAEAGLDFEALKGQARSMAFQPVTLRNATFSADYKVEHSRIESRNVIGVLPGRRRPGETIMIAAHWDAYGIGAPDATGDRIRRGAADDALGVAGVIELARVFASGPRPQRSLVFAAWTAEERGLLGSEYYAVHPLFPLEDTVANFTLDVLQTAGPARDVVLVGAGQNQLDAYLERAAAAQGRTVTPDAKPERGLAFRADHFSLARRGVPALLLMAIGGGADLVQGGREAGDRWVSEFTANCYHQPCDAWRADWDLRGAVQDVALVHEMSRRLANSRDWPEWQEGSEFKAVRDLARAGRRRSATP